MKKFRNKFRTHQTKAYLAAVSFREKEKLLGVCQTAAGLVLRRMVESGELVREGNSHNVQYLSNGEFARVIRRVK